MSQSSSNKISLLAATIIGLNAMIGVGIVVIPSILSRHVGPAGIVTYLLSLFVTLALGIALGRVAQIYPGEGWTYTYPAKWAGHKVGLFAAFSYILGVLVAMGFCIQQTGIWLHQLLPIANPIILGIGITLILMFLVLAGAQASSIGQYIIGGFVVTSLLAASFVCWTHFNPGLLHPFMPHGVLAIFEQAPRTLFTFLGFECIISLFAIVENPSKNVPRAFIFAISGVGMLYLVFTTGIFFSIPASYFSNGLEITLASVLGSAFPTSPWLPYAVLIGALFGLIGTIHSMLWSASELMIDVLKKVKAQKIKHLLGSNKLTLNKAVVISTIIMISCSLLFHAEALMDLTNLLIVVPTVLSVMVLLFIKSEWKLSRNGIAIIGLCSGLLMIYFAAEGFWQSLYTLWK